MQEECEDVLHRYDPEVLLYLRDGLTETRSECRGIGPETVEDDRLRCVVMKAVRNVRCQFGEFLVIKYRVIERRIERDEHPVTERVDCSVVEGILPVKGSSFLPEPFPDLTSSCVRV